MQGWSRSAKRWAGLTQRSTAGRSSSLAWVFKRQHVAANAAAIVTMGRKVYLSPHHSHKTQSSLNLSKEE